MAGGKPDRPGKPFASACYGQMLTIQSANPKVRTRSCELERQMSLLRSHAFTYSATGRHRVLL